MLTENANAQTGEFAFQAQPSILTSIKSFFQYPARLQKIWPHSIRDGAVFLVQTKKAVRFVRLNWFIMT